MHFEFRHGLYGSSSVPSPMESPFMSPRLVQNDSLALQSTLINHPFVGFLLLKLGLGPHHTICRAKSCLSISLVSFVVTVGLKA